MPHGEGRQPSLTSRRMEYVIEMMGRQATLARLRKSRRLPLTEAAYNGHHEVLQVGRVCFCSSGGRYSVDHRAIRHAAGALRNTKLRVCVGEREPGERLSAQTGIILIAQVM